MGKTKSTGKAQIWGILSRQSVASLFGHCQSVASLFGQSFAIYVHKNSSGMLDILNFSDIIKNTDKTCAYLMHNKLIGFIFMEGPW